MFWINELTESFDSNDIRLQGEFIYPGEVFLSLLSLEIKERDLSGQDCVAEKSLTSGFKITLMAHKIHGPGRSGVILRPSENPQKWWVSSFGVHKSDSRGYFVGIGAEELSESWTLVHQMDLDYVVQQKLNRRRPIAQA